MRTWVELSRSRFEIVQVKGVCVCTYLYVWCAERLGVGGVEENIYTYVSMHEEWWVAICDREAKKTLSRARTHTSLCYIFPGKHHREANGSVRRKDLPRCSQNACTSDPILNTEQLAYKRHQSSVGSWRSIQSRAELQRRRTELDSEDNMGGGVLKSNRLKPKKSKSTRAGLTFPVSRIHGLLKKGQYAKHIGVGSSVYLAAVLEYLLAELLELAGNAARDNKKTRIIPRHLQLAIRNDSELNGLLQGVTISQGGVLPFIHSVLLPKKKDHGSDKNSSHTEK